MDSRINARLLPARRNAGVRVPGSYVWCNSVIHADGKWHAFCSSWRTREEPDRHSTVELLQNYWCLSKIIRAEADCPEGPYEPQETVLQGRGGDHWVYECCHNPCVVRVKDMFVLYFQTKGRKHDDRYIGYATALSVHGPWTLGDRPLNLGFNVNNPSVWVEVDGTVRMAFRQPGMRIGIAEANAYDSEYKIINPDIFPGISLEDPFLYKIGSEYHMLIEDNKGQLTGDVRHGAHLVSADGISFSVYSPEPKAYSHTVAWQDGGETTFDRRERPWLIIQDGCPTHLVTGVLLHHDAWSLVQPLLSE